MAIDSTLAQLIKISNTVGKDVSLVQGGGGNTSVKTPDAKNMYIKASGASLKDMSPKKGWRRMNLPKTLAIIKDKSLTRLNTDRREAEVVSRLLTACNDNLDTPARPSVEANLHAFLDRCVIHLHPDAVNAYANAKNGKAALEKLFEDQKLPPLWIPYCDPGLTLARKISSLIDDYQKQFGQKPAILFLEKHGLLVSANNPNTALRLVRKVIDRCKTRLKKPPAVKLKSIPQDSITTAALSIRGAYFKATGRCCVINYFYDKNIAAFLAQRNAKKMLAAPALAPDEQVYANGPAIWIDKCDTKKIAAALNRRIKTSGKPPSAFLVKGVGLFVAANTKTASTIKDIAESSFFIRSNASRMGGIISLSKRQRDFIDRWEAEAFRKTLAAGKTAGELQNRIALVTGAASGLGRSIAIGLAKAGAHVALCDIDVKSAEKTASIINTKTPAVQTIVLKCDVTNETSVNKSFASVLKNLGGLDILVSAAGLAPPYALVDLPLDKWRSALEVNLTGYFLAAKAAAKIMIAQQIGGSIINLSSKSGLQASRDNTAYNATKAGEIHMARGWALELGSHGIRVNSLAPGNVFENSKIWNPEYIKVCAKKYGIKPEEVIGYYVSKTALNREIKGSDIADAVVFLCSDKARTITGQTLVADSGQVMVR